MCRAERERLLSDCLAAVEALRREAVLSVGGLFQLQFLQEALTRLREETLQVSE